MIQLLISSGSFQVEITAYLPPHPQPHLLLSLKQDGRRDADFIEACVHPKPSAYSKD